MDGENLAPPYSPSNVAMTALRSLRWRKNFSIHHGHDCREFLTSACTIRGPGKRFRGPYSGLCTVETLLVNSDVEPTGERLITCYYEVVHKKAPSNLPGAE